MKTQFNIIRAAHGERTVVGGWSRDAFHMVAIGSNRSAAGAVVKLAVTVAEQRFNESHDMHPWRG